MAIPSSRARSHSGHPSQLAGMVLIVDDDRMVGEVMHRALSRSGRPSLLAHDPREAIALAARYPIALLVTDYLMPGMTGLELATRVRERHPEIPVILVSGSPEASSLTIEPPAAFLAKPMTMGDLANAVASFAPLSAGTL